MENLVLIIFSLTSDVTLHAQLMVTKTKLLGSPYTKCLPETQANKCYQEKTEEHIRNRLVTIGYIGGSKSEL